MHAQTCTVPAPAITVPGEVCPMGFTTATVAPPEGGGSWTSSTWDIANGTFQGPYGPVLTVSGETANFNPDQSGLPVELRVRVTDSAGCVGESNATVALRTIAAPAITAPGEICPMGFGSASVAPPAEGGAWASVHWSIVNGAFQGPYGPTSTMTGETAGFYGDGSELPIELTVQAWDEMYCGTESTTTVAMRTIAPPVISAPAEVCPMGHGAVSVAPPAEGGSWMSVSWTIVNGAFYGPYGPTSTASGTTATFHPDESGLPVEIGVRVFDEAYCQAESSTTVALRTIVPPVIDAPSEMCPISAGTATVAPPAEGGAWMAVQWEIVNGYFQSPYGPGSSASGESVTFYASESGLPIQLRARAYDGQYCMSESTKTIGMRSIAGPVVVAPASVCAGIVQTASVPDGDWMSVGWEITGGKFLISDYPGESETTTGRTVQFRADGSAPVTLEVRGWDPSYCEGETTLVIANETPVPVIEVTPRPVPAAADATASVAPPAQGVYTSYLWEIEGGTLQSPATEPTVVFRASGTEPVVLRMTVTSDTGCVGTSEERFLVEGSPLLIEAPESFCSTSVSKVASLYAEGEITNVQWSITNGTINGSTTAASISFIPTGQGAVTLSVTAQVNGVGTSATEAVPFGAPELLVTESSDTACKWRYTDIDVVDPELWSHMQYQIQGGYFGQIGPGYDARFVADSDTTPVTVTLTGFTDDDCPVVWTKTFETPLAPMMSFSQPSLCAGGTQTATFTNVGEFQSWSWGIVNGTFTTPLPTFDQPTTVTFRANGTAPVQISLFGYNGTTGCGVNSVRTLPVVASPVPTITASAAQLCPGGSVTLTASNAASYLWSNGATTQSITVDTVGTYSVTVTADSGCQGSATADVTAASVVPAAITPSGPTTFCSGGQVTLTANEGASYLWSNGAETREITVAVAGDYSVSVTYANGCSSTSAAATVLVNEAPAPAVTASGPTSFCEGGAVTLTASVAAGYVWSTGETTQSITVRSSGSYTVTVTDGNGCTAISAATTVMVHPNPPTPVIDASGPTAFCEGGSVTLTAPGGHASYLWSTGATTQSIVVSEAGSYSVMVTDENGCAATSPATDVTVHAPPATPAITASGSTTFCEGGSVTLTAPGGQTSYLWSTGATTQSIVVSDSGSYSVTVTNGSGCTATSADMVVTVQAAPATPAITASGATSFCQNDSVTLTAPEATSYLWSNGSTTQSIIVGASGSYSVTVTNASGCSATSAATVVTVRPLPPTTITSSGPATFCAGGGTTLSAPVGAYTYLWSTGETTRQLSVSTSGDYSVTVTDASGCSATSAPFTVTVNTPVKPTITADGPTVFCPGGSVTLTASEGAGYVWSSGETTRSITVSPATTRSYSVTVTDANGCAKSSDGLTIFVDEMAKPTITAIATTFCASTTLMTGQSAGYTYRWSTGETTPNITVTEGGSYSVTVTNTTGCSSTSEPITVVRNPRPTATVTGGGSYCTSGSATVRADLTGNGPWSITWSDGEVQSGITEPFVERTVSPASTTTYRIIAISDTLCGGDSTGQAVVTVTAAPPKPPITVAGSTTFCEGSSVTLSTGYGGYTYLWSNGATTPSITVRTGGTYTLTLTNSSGCSTTSDPVVVTVHPKPPVPTIAADGPTTFCSGSSVNLAAPDGFTYLWSNGATTQSINVAASGNYSVTVRNANGCSATSAPTTVTMNPAPLTPTINASDPTTFCEGRSVTLHAPGGYASYLWSNGATTSSIVVSTSGSYSVTVTAANGCSATSAPSVVTVEPLPPTPTITASGPTTFCAGGSVALTASEGQSFLWSNGATTHSITVFTTGNYSVTVTGANGCKSTSEPTPVMVHPAPTPATITASGPTTFCEGGSVTLTASGGQSFLWSNGATTQSIHVTSGGSYSVTVTDANGCASTSSPTTITVRPLPEAEITASATTLCEMGEATLTATPAASYLWSNGATTQSITVTTAGTYSVTVSDGFCSKTSAPVTVVEEATTVTVTGSDNQLCPGEAVTVTSSVEGTAVSYQWHGFGGAALPGETGPTLTVVPSNIGTSYYFLRVTTPAGCTIQSNTFVFQVTQPDATISANGPTTFCEGAWVELSVPDQSGYTYLWSNGATSRSITANASGSYSVTVTDTNGCSATSEPTTVTVHANPSTPTITASGATTFCEGGSVTLTAPGGQASYLWSTGATTASIDVSTSGTFSVTVTNDNGCTATSAAAAVTVHAKPATPAIAASGSTTLCEGGSVTLTAPGGQASYLWSTGATSQSIDVTTDGSYTVTVRNVNGCSATSAPTNVTVNPSPATPTVTASGATTLCEGESVRLTAPAGFSYLWSNGATSQSIDVTTGGSYTVMITNANGCSATSAATSVTVHPRPAVPVITASGATTFCEGGSVTLTAPAGFAYLWSNGATSQSIEVATSGSYSVIVMNANGCSRTSAATTVTVNARPATPAIIASGSTTFCAGGSVTLTAPAGFTYLWSNGATTQSISAVDSGSYSVTVTNASGCSATSAATIVTVTAATSISQQPQSVTIPRNSSTTLSVTASGTGTVTYQWYRGTSGNTSNPISGATSFQYTTPRLNKGTYAYWVRVASSCGTVDSSTVTVSVP